MASLPSKYLSSIASVVPFFRTCLVLTLFFDPLRWGSDPYTLAWIGIAIATDFYLGWSCTETSAAVSNLFLCQTFRIRIDKRRWQTSLTKPYISYTQEETLVEWI